MLDVKPYRQKPELCGPASLKMVLDFFGIEKSENELAKMCGYKTSKGVALEGLLKATKGLGLKTFYKDFAKIKDLKSYVIDRKIPVIVDWFSTDDGHYSVVVDIDDKNIYMQDPELGGLKIMDLETFKRVWFDFTGNFLKSKDQLIIRRLIVIFA